MQVIRYFALNDLIASRRAKEMGIDNRPISELDAALRLTLAGCERLRAYLGHPMKITSGYRCPALNDEVGGAKDSQHLRGEAVDFVCPAFGTPAEVATSLSKARYILGIDQLILEPGWVHVSFTLEPRGEVLRKTATGYSTGLTEA